MVIIKASDLEVVLGVTHKYVKQSFALENNTHGNC